MRDTLAEWVVPAGAVDDVVLLVSELVTNAVVHARSASRVSIDRRDDVLVVQVADEAAELPRRRDVAVDAESGRGLLLVERLARAWGVHLDGAGKIVWFELDVADGPTGTARPAR